MKAKILSLLTILALGLAGLQAPASATGSPAIASVFGSHVSSTSDSSQIIAAKSKKDDAKTEADDEDDGKTTTESSNTAILKDCGAKADDPNGAGIVCILELVVEVMTVGVGILGVLGITIVGIQYLTAGGSEEKTRKAKRRLFEIIIGLVAYVVIYALLYWLIPDFHPF